METKHKILVIINPISGTGNKADIPKLIAEKLDADKFDVQIAYTEYGGHATELAKQAIADCAYGVIAVGGDGTVNEVASALINSDVALGIIPKGSGNGLARHIGIPMNDGNALSIINENHLDDLDYCTVNSRPFFCTCGMGFDAAVSEKFAESKRRGPITYIRSAILEYLKYRCEDYELDVLGEKFTKKAFVIACCNASQYGNNAYIAPNASMHDGLLDITIIHPLTPFDTAPLGILLFTKNIDKDTNIQCLRAPEITVTRQHAGVIHIDGEPIQMDSTLKIQCHKAGLKMFTPQAGKGNQSILTPIGDNLREFIKEIKHELNIK